MKAIVDKYPGPYLTIAEAAELCRVKPETMRERIYQRVYTRGIHYFRPQGSRPLFKRSELIKWLEENKAPKAEVEENIGIPMARGYTLGSKRRFQSAAR